LSECLDLLLIKEGEGSFKAMQEACKLNFGGFKNKTGLNRGKGKRYFA